VVGCVPPLDRVIMKNCMNPKYEELCLPEGTISYRIISFIYFLFIRTGLQNPYGYGYSHILGVKR